MRHIARMTEGISSISEWPEPCLWAARDASLALPASGARRRGGLRVELAGARSPEHPPAAAAERRPGADQRSVHRGGVRGRSSVAREPALQAGRTELQLVGRHVGELSAVRRRRVRRRPEPQDLPDRDELPRQHVRERRRSSVQMDDALRASAEHHALPDGRWLRSEAGDRRRLQRRRDRRTRVHGVPVALRLAADLRLSTPSSPGSSELGIRRLEEASPSTRAR